MEWWRWVAAGAETLLITVFVLLRFDSLREQGRGTGRAALLHGLVWALLVPAGFLAVLLSPAWLVLVLIAVPALAIAVLALAS
ncbi:hypothetical protein [Nakamurella leprariae]|uniref:Uncharacterized protein n=1 Tax=Nakamurella leprariae TaxID=2803911 RepID=A0A938YGH2_9ACTN|nr:hypothetical protein [Nakamurella leprariae]MBM9467388.1 hypothetical protein [Nakamurella leprariae]